MGRNALVLVVCILLALAVGFLAGRTQITGRVGDVSEPPEMAEIESASKEPDTSQPTPVHTVTPEYPETARKEGIQGTVYIRMLVDTTGHVAEAEVLESVHPALDRAGLEAARGWRFSPARFMDRPVRQYVTIPVKFALK